jgi:hypothetical protein
MKVLEDFEEGEEAEEKRAVVGILKKDDELKLEFPDGKITIFGYDRTRSDIYVPHEGFDDEQFAIFRRDNNCYLVDKSNKFTTAIKV